MKKSLAGLALMGTLLCLWSVAGLAQPASPGPAAHWAGKVQLGDREVALTVDLAQNPKGMWIGSMSVTGTSQVDVPLNSIAIDGASVRFAANLPERASFDGRLSADGNGFTGKASNAAGDAPFQFARSGEPNVKVPPPSSALSKEFEGNWEGSIDVGGTVRRVALKLAPGAEGAATATLIAIDQGNQEIPVSTVTIKDKQLDLDVRSVSGTYHGALGATGEIAGEWTQGGNHLPLNFKRPSK